ncbi:MAG: tetratricopeptide repeat protein [Bacteroidetes bacterium]|nr:tetratricopeptide repeat protein [Bacteroidota bacterium]
MRGSKRNILLFFCAIICAPYFSFAQNERVDALKDSIAAEKNDSAKVMQIAALFDIYQRDYKLEECKKLADDALILSANSKVKIVIGMANLLKGISFKDYEDYPNAQTYLLIALKNLDREANKRALGNANSYMGYIQEQMNDDTRAISYHRTALKLRMEISEKLTINSLLRIASCFTDLKKFDSAYHYFYKGIGLCNKYNNKRSSSGFYNNLGIAYSHDKKPDSSLVYYQKALNVLIEFKDSASIAGALINVGGLYYELKNYDKAIEYYKRGLWMANKTGYKEWIANGASGLASVYYERQEYKLAYDNYKLSRDYRDSLFNEAKASDIANAEEKYQSEKKQQELQIADLKIKMQGDQLHKSDTQRTMLIVGLIISLIVFLLMLWGYRKMKKLTKELSFVNKEVVKQNSIIEEKNKDITDSIQYAKQIQKALLSSDDLFAKSFKDYFIFFKPKDIVSGDFYWAYKDDKEILIANADCTGHGVPGAFMSLIGVSKLNEIVKERNIRDTDKIMDQLRDGILEIFSTANQKQQSKDGMDMVMMRYNFTTAKLQFSCANNSLWLLRNGELIKHKADKFPVGFSYGSKQPFTLNEITLQEGDVVLTFSDGYADQFGGVGGKKFKYKNLQKIIVDMAQQPLTEMKNVLADTLKKWQGDLEQVDDITVIGFKV